MSDPFVNFMPGLEAPASSAFAVTPADSDLAKFTRALYVGGAGNLSLRLVGDSADVTFTAVPAGTTLPVRCKRVNSTNTTATSIVGLV